ncbi:MAG: putative GH25 family protein/5-hydroxyisourate hydrolase-like protein (transthyretin family), partial [Glaciecola sp.]
MNLKSSLILLGLVVLAIGAYFFTQSGEGDQTGGMENAISAAEIADEDPVETNLVGEGNLADGEETERQVVPENQSPAALEPEPAAIENKQLNEVSAQVVNASGEGLEGIEVTIRSISIEDRFSIRAWDAPELVKATTGEQGRVAFKVSADPFVVRIEEAGFVVSEIEFPAGTEKGEDLGVWELTRALVLSGQIVGPNGQPVAGAKIVAPEEGGLVMIFNGEVKSIAETDAAGRFTIDTLEPGSWRLMVNSENYPDQVFSGEATTELQQGGLLWNLNEGETLRGRLTGRPAFSTRGLIVRMDLASRVNWEALLGAASDGFPKLGRRVDILPDGTFAIAGLHPQTKYRVRVLEKENQGEGFGVGPSLAEEKTVASSVGTVDLIWSTKAGLQLTVLDNETSLPVEEFTLESDDMDYYQAFQTEGKHPEGKLDMGGLQLSSKPMTIRVQADGYEPYSIDSVEFHSGNVTHLGTVRLQPGKLIRIHVVDAHTGKSAKGVRINLTSQRKQEEEEQTHGITGFSFDLLGADSMHQSGKTDEEGMVSLRYLEGTTGTVKARHTRFAPAEITDVDLTAFRKEPLRVELWQGGDLRVLVLDANDEPVKGVKVEMKPAAQEEVKGIGFSFSSGPMHSNRGKTKNTNSKGLAKFTHVPAGEYRCTVAWPGSSDGPSIIMVVDDGEDSSDKEPEGELVTIQEGGNQELTMAAPLRSSLQGTIKENGTPLVGARITVAKAGAPGGFAGMFGGQGQGVRTDRDGHFVLDDL